MASVVDLWIEDNDLVFGSDGEPLELEDADAIAQDIKHLIRESGLLANLVGSRGTETRAILQEIKLVVREEERVKPDEIEMEVVSGSLIRIAVQTVDDLDLVVEVSND